MALWGASDADEAKPKNLTTAEKKEVFANASGWVREAGSKWSGNGNTSATPEVLVAIGGLTTALGVADIVNVDFITLSVDEGTPADFSVLVRFNEAVDVDTSGGTPTLTLDNDQTGGGSIASLALEYASGTGTNELTFTKAWTAAQFAKNDVLTIARDALALNSGTIKDAGTSDDSTITYASSLVDPQAGVTVA